MHPAIRTQALAGMGNDGPSDAAAIDFTDSEDMARQEFKLDADINVILSRFGVDTPMRRVTFGEVDFGLDLQTALSVVDQATRAYNTLPQDLRLEFQTWQSVLNGLVSGQLKVRLQQHAAENPIPPREPPRITPTSDPA